MTSTVVSEPDPTCGSNSLILRTDARGRVFTPIERREALLAEYARSGLSGKEFARLAGVKYSTFQYWRQCRKGRSGGSKSTTPAPGQPVAWLEAVVQQAAPASTSGLVLHLPGGVRAEITSGASIPLAAALVRALEKPC